MIVKIKNGRYKGQTGKIVGAGKVSDFRIEIKDGPGVGDVVEMSSQMVEIITAIIQLIRIVRGWFKKSK